MECVMSTDEKTESLVMGPITQDSILPKLETYRRLLANTFSDWLDVEVRYKPADVHKVAGDTGLEIVSPTWWEVTAKRNSIICKNIPSKDLACAYQRAFKNAGMSAQRCLQILAVGSRVLISDAAMQELHKVLELDPTLDESAVKRNAFLQTVLVDTGTVRSSQGRA
jgi:hypothetical protein